MRKKIEEEQETYDLYQGLLGRSRELYDIKCDLHQLKCAALTYLGDTKSLPPKPSYDPPPALNIHPPSGELIRSLQQMEFKESRVKPTQETGRRRAKENDIFRTIMDQKGNDSVDELRVLIENEDGLSDSWEDVQSEFPETGYSDVLS